MNKVLQPEVAKVQPGQYQLTGALVTVTWLGDILHITGLVAGEVVQCIRVDGRKVTYNLGRGQVTSILKPVKPTTKQPPG